VEAAGATYVARGVAAEPVPLQRVIRDGITHKGFSFIEAISQCPTEFGKRNAPKGQVAMLEDQKARAITVAKAAKLPPEELPGRIITGVLHRDDDVPELTARYAALVERVRGVAAGESPGNR
jgi:2-oxoglutarate ferredoxin oxidoreductase subunit beta